MNGLRTAGARILPLVLLAGTALAAIYLSRADETLLLLGESAIPLLVACTAGLAAYGTGSLALRALTRQPAAPSIAETLLIGVAAFGTLTGLVALISTKPVPALTIALAAAGLFLLARRRPALSWPASPAAFALVPPVLLAIAQAITPVVSADELIYKLAVPHSYSLWGRMVEQPLNSNSYIALSFYLADLPALMLGGAIAAKLVHLLIYLASLHALWRLAARLSSSTAAAWWTVAVVAYTPVLMITAGWAFSEWGVLGLLAISFERYERWVDGADSADLVIASAAAGAALSAKYTALPWIAPFALLVLWRHRRDRRALAVAALLVALFGAFFYVRNAIWTGSPVAPMLLPDAPKVQNYRSGYAFSGWVDLVRGKDIIDPEIADEAMGILLPLCVLASLAAIRSRDRFTRDLLFIGAVQSAILLTIAPGSRNMINGAVALALPGAAAISAAWRASGPALRTVAVCAAVFAGGAQSILALQSIQPVMPYLAGQEGEEELVARLRTFRAPYAWMARSTSPHARLLLLAETRTLTLERQSIGGGNLDGPRVARWLASFPSAAAMHEGLQRMGVTHVLLHPAWYRVAPEGARPFGMLNSELGLAVPPATNAILMQFLSEYGSVRYRDNEYVIFELKR